MKLAHSLIMLLLLACVSISCTWATDGDLRSTFGSNGVLKPPRWPANSRVTVVDTVAQSDGKVLMFGSADGMPYVARLNSNGISDASFGQNGSIIVDFVGQGGLLNAVTSTASGKLLLAGYLAPESGGGGSTSIFIARLNVDGQMDNSFGDAGLVVIKPAMIGGSAQVITELSDGRIVIAGRTDWGGALFAFNSNGSVDSTFGSQGRTEFLLPDGIARWDTLVRQADDRIIVGGRSNSTHIIARYFSNGTLDTSFANGGIFTAELGHNSLLSDMALQNDGKIIVVGSIEQPFACNDILVQRLNSDGSRDNTFGDAGQKAIGISKYFNRTGADSFDEGMRVIVQQDQKIVVIGLSDSQEGSGISIARLNIVGEFDESFSDDGFDLYESGSDYDYAQGLLVLPLGDIWVFGYKEESGFPAKAMSVRWFANGVRNLQWGENGELETPIENGWVAPWMDIAYEPAGSGMMVMVGSAETYSGRSMAAVRYDSNGNLDRTFGKDGYAEVHFDNKLSYVNAIKTQSDGKKVLAGHVEYSWQYDMALARLTPDGLLDESFGDHGTKIIAMLDSNEILEDVVVRNDDAIFATGSIKTGETSYDTLVIGMDKNGGPLTDFGNNGRVIVDMGGSNERVVAVGLQSDHKIVVSGFAADDSVWSAVAVRLLPNGQLDTSFGDNGRFRFRPDDSTAAALDMQILMDDTILLTGSSNGNLLLLKLAPNGRLLTTFADQGVVASDTDALSKGQGRAIKVHGDGKIYVAGSYDRDFVLWRFDANGNHDESFNTAGKVRAVINTLDNYPEAIEIATNGDLIAAGACSSACVARYQITGVDVPSLSTAAIQFENTIAGQYSAHQSVRLSNIGTGAIRTDALLVSSNFQYQSKCPLWLRATDYCDIELWFAPTMEGQHDGILRITSANGSAEAQLHGTGLPTDFDNDGIPDRDDNDDDNDGFADITDAFPFNATEWLDSDSDHIGNNADGDDDNDGVADSEDVFPLDALEQIDNDQDGIGNNSDTDDDDDGIVDANDPQPFFNAQHLPVQRALHVYTFDQRTLADWVTGAQQMIAHAEGNIFAQDRLSGLTLSANRTQGYFDLVDDFSDAHFSISFWYRASANSGQTIVLANKLASDSNAVGVVLIDENNTLQLQVSDGVQQQQSAALSYTPGSWLLVSIRVNPEINSLALNVVTPPSRVKTSVMNHVQPSPIQRSKWLSAANFRFNEDLSAIANLANPTVLTADEIAVWQADLSNLSLLAIANAPAALDSYLPARAIDSDSDGVPDTLDGDDDNDGVPDELDAFPRDAGESVDTDNDGLGNNIDPDDDNDSVADTADAFPLNANESVDSDGDGLGNNADTDDDNDTVADSADAFPLDANESIDNDGDGIGNNADTDDDNDGHLDSEDKYPLDPTRWTDNVAGGGGGGGGVPLLMLIMSCLLLFMRSMPRTAE